MDLKVLYTNSQSIIGKIDELSSVASDLRPDVILITESWCNNLITDAFLTIPGNELLQDLRRDRSDTARGRGGGLLVYAKTGLCVLSFDVVDSLFQYCKFKIEDVTFYLVYRSPSSSQDSITELTDLVRNADKNCIFVGDFNLPEIDWSNGRAQGRAKELLEAAENRLMEQMVTFSTHVRVNTLDLVITDMPERVAEVTEEGRLGTSDHVIIQMNIVIRSSMQPESRGLPDWHRADWAGMRRDFERDRWPARLRGMSAAQAWTALKERVHELVSKHVPERRRRNHNRPPWLSREILRTIRKKKRL
jgi:Endonuclease-reverse transcriptase